MTLFFDKLNKIKLEDRRERKRLSKNSRNALKDIIKLWISQALEEEMCKICTLKLKIYASHLRNNYIRSN